MDVISNKKQQLPVFNQLKGLGIILVVLGHSISGVISSEYSDQNSFSLIYYIYDLVEAFQMPLFFWISGVLFAYSSKDKDISYSSIFKRKLIDLGIPYLFGNIIYLLFGYATKSEKYTLAAFLNCWHMPVAHFWFIYIQIIIYSLLFIFGYKNKYLIKTTVVIFLIWILYPFMFFSGTIEKYFLLGNLMYYSFFFCVGELFVIYDLFKKRIFSRNMTYMIGSCIAFIVLFSLAEILDVYDRHYIRTLISVIGVYAFSQFTANTVKKDSKVELFISKLGKDTMPIYMFHSLFVALTRIVLLKIGHGYHVFVIIICTVVGVALPFCISKLSKYIAVLDIVCYPRRFLNRKKLTCD